MRCGFEDGAAGCGTVPDLVNVIGRGFLIRSIGLRSRIANRKGNEAATSNAASWLPAARPWEQLAALEK
jgi:hypothetical protein